ncbi:MAG: nucleoside deaminase [Pyrinomonadaceae bacterium]
MKETNDEKFMKRAIELARTGMQNNAGGPFGAVIVKENEIIAEGWNTVTSTNDPTAHAEINAIRNACDALDGFQLLGCTIYTSCEPCPMCLGAIYWARPDRVFFAGTRADAADAGFDDEFIYEELTRSRAQRKIPTETILRNDAVKVFEEWNEYLDKVEY